VTTPQSYRRLEHSMSVGICLAVSAILLVALRRMPSGYWSRDSSRTPDASGADGARTRVLKNLLAMTRRRSLVDYHQRPGHSSMTSHNRRPVIWLKTSR
jgi:hypothetical protein